MIKVVLFLCVVGFLVWVVCQYLKSCYPLMTATLQQGHYDLMEKFLQFCRQHNLGVFVIAGTLLGAHRHNSMIPWDDDIDVGLLKVDFERLWNLQTSLLDYGLVVRKCDDIVRIYHKNQVTRRFHTVPLIDVFPFEQKGTRIQYATRQLRRTYPREYFLVPEITTLQWYQFGSLQVPGPTNIDAICLRQWGPKWFEPRAKLIKTILYRKKVEKMMENYRRSPRYQQLSWSKIKN